MTPLAKMPPGQLLAEYYCRGIHLRAEGEKLRFTCDLEPLTPADVELLTRRKGQLIDTAHHVQRLMAGGLDEWDAVALVLAEEASGH
jgi:hypothetical protein